VLHFLPIKLPHDCIYIPEQSPLSSIIWPVFRWPILITLPQHHIIASIFQEKCSSHNPTSNRPTELQVNSLKSQWPQGCTAKPTLHITVVCLMSQNKLLSLPTSASVRKAPFCCTFKGLKIMTRERMVFAAKKKNGCGGYFHSNQVGYRWVGQDSMMQIQNHHHPHPQDLPSL